MSIPEIDNTGCHGACGSREDFNATEALASEPPAGYRQHNAEMNLAWQFINYTGMSVFLTGKAGTGKTTFLRHLRECLPKRMVVLAPTGVAAINAGGQTIHSFFQISPGPYLPGMPDKDKSNSFKMAAWKKQLIKTLDLLVIDEVSMVRADLLDAIDNSLRKYRDASRPFGGVQLLLIGDLMQLSPVTTEADWRIISHVYDTPYFFSSHALKQLQYVTVELKHVYRQQNRDFIDLLGNVRNGNINASVISALNSRYIPGFEPTEKGWIHLTTHNATARQYNESRLAALPGPEYTFNATVKDEFPEINYPTDSKLHLKIGAQVMFVKNDTSLRHLYYNGKIGTVTAFPEKGIMVLCEGDEEPILVERVTWDNVRYIINNETKEIVEDVIGQYCQYPLRTAWAITVHKSQGLTFDHAVLDINASFAHGQVYVALSRCRTLEGLVLSRPVTPQSVITDQTVNSYIESETATLSDNVSRLPALKFDYTLSLLDELYSFQRLQAAFRWLTRVVDEHLAKRQPELLNQLKEFDSGFAAAITDIAARFRKYYVAELPKCGDRMTQTPLAERITSSANYFCDKLAELFVPLMRALEIQIDNKNIATIYYNAVDNLRENLALKNAIFHRLKTTPFSTCNYLKIKAQARLTIEANASAAPTRKTTSKAKAKPRTKAKAKKQPK